MVPGQIPSISRSDTTTFTTDACHTHPWYAAVHRLGVSWPQARGMIGCLASSALQYRLCAFASTATNMTEFTAPAAPILFAVLLRTLLR